MIYWWLTRNHPRSLHSQHRRGPPRHHSREPERMRINQIEAARQTGPLALDAVGIKECSVIIRPSGLFGLLLHDSYVGIRNSKPSLCIVISDAFQQSLSGAERKRNEPMKHNRVSDRQRQDDQQRAEDERKRIVPSLSDKLQFVEIG